MLLTRPYSLSSFTALSGYIPSQHSQFSYLTQHCLSLQLSQHHRSTPSLSASQSSMNPAQVPKDARSQSFLPKQGHRKPKHIANPIPLKSRSRRMRKLRDNILGISMSSSSLSSSLVQYDMVFVVQSSTAETRLDWQLLTQPSPSSPGHPVRIHTGPGQPDRQNSPSPSFMNTTDNKETAASRAAAESCGSRLRCTTRSGRQSARDWRRWVSIYLATESTCMGHRWLLICVVCV